MKKIRILLIALILILGGAALNKTYAADETRSLGANMQRPFNNATYQYGVEGKSAGSMLYYTAVKIFDNLDRDASNNLLYNSAIYCIRGGKGFGQGSADNTTDVSSSPIDYIQAEASEMHANAKDVIAKYNELYSVNLDRVEKFKSKDSTEKDVNIYNAILWILDESYLPKDKLNSESKVVYSATEYKAELLDKAGVPIVQQKDITDDDLEVVQQLAIWYFANYDEQNAGIKPTVSQATMYPGQFLTINGNNNIDSKREENLNRIYQYLIYGAIDNSSSFVTDGATGARTKSIAKSEFDKTEVLKITSNDSEDLGLYKYYQIGPVKIANDVNNRAASSSLAANSIILYDKEGNPIPKLYPIYEQQERPGPNGETIYGDKVHTGNHVIYRFVNEAGQEVTSLQEGLKYYIRFYKVFEKGSTILPIIKEEEKYDVSKITLKVTSSYSLSTATFLYAKENAKENQAVVELEKEKISESDEITTREFDLSLRKFITSINEKTYDRVPSINTNTLIQGITNRTGEKEYTATYTHPKDALKVETGNKVIYTIRIYNEGELDGTATQVTDYLPSGLELVPASESTINTKYKWTNPSGDGKTIVTDYLKDTTIKAFDEKLTAETAGEGWQKSTIGVSGLYYADLQVECIVKAEISGEDKALRNIAEITADSNDDRDSVPGNVGLDNYAPEGDNSTYQEDDDDYEDLILPAKKFDLALRKYIVGLKREGNTVEIPNERDLNNIDLTKLASGEETTAEYKHRKDPVEVKTGDIVTYKFAVYNEGEIDGYVYSITDYLPEGLELDTTGLTKVDSSDENVEIWKEEIFDNGIPGITQRTTYTFNKNLKKLVITKEYIHASSVINPETGTLQEPTIENFVFKLNAFDGTKLDSDSIDVKFKVTAETSDNDKVLTNAATMTYGTKEEATVEQAIKDRDSNKTGEEFNVPTAEKLLEDLPGYKGNESNINDLQKEDYHYKGQQDDDDFEKVIIKGQEFDLSLRKYIVSINGKTLTDEESRAPKIDTSKLNTINPTTGKKITTADYKHKKYPVEVKVGDTVTYRFTVYNEGEVDGLVYSIKDYLPKGLEFDVAKNPNFVEYKENYMYTSEELQGKEYAYKIQGNTIEILPISSVMLDEGGILWLHELKAFDGTKLDSASIDVKFKVTANNSNEDQVLTNVATMTYSAKGTEQKDRDSSKDEFNVPTAEKLLEGLPGYKGNNSNKNELNDSAYHYEGQQDDDDFEKVIIKGKPFDLALRKFITSIKRNGAEVEFEDRTPSIDTTTLINGTFDRNGQKEYTATYEHSKEPLVVKQGDIVTYTLRIYNEGERDGFATEITDYIPEGLALILNYDTNYNNGWKLQEDFNYDRLMNLVGEKGFYKTEKDVKNLKIEDFEGIESLKNVQLATGKVTITSAMLQDELIKAFDETIVNMAQSAEGTQWQKAEKGEGGLYYKDIQVSCLVIAENTCKDVLTNKAEISEDKDEYKQDVNDRDSTPDNVASKNEDDDDYEPVVLKYFDLALRKFITGVETNGKTKNVTSRIPVAKMSEDGSIVYEHTKEPVHVANNDTVIYTLRVYNEGTLAGYAEEITDDIPEGLEYLPKHSVNKQYEWVMIDKDGKITEKVEEAVKITTDYLSEEKEIKSKMTITDETTGEVSSPTNTRDNLIDPFDSSKAISNKEPLNPDYKDIKVAFKVIEPNTSDRIIVNSAQISEDSDDDEDSDPGKWNEGEDDQDREYIYVKYFDLSLLKWVTQTIVTVDGKTTTTETGFEPNTGKTETTGIRDNKEAEPIAKVEVDRKKLKKTTVKFVYNIKVTNEGEIAGYATEITDYIPEGLEFFSEDNKAFGWEKDGKNKVTTRALETVLLKPGESATVKIVFRWKNDAKNLGLKTNIAEISEDFNEYNSKDIDSDPDNKLKTYEKEQEDDDDFALVILSIKTGKGASYTILIMSMITLLGSGTYLIKKYVLDS